MPMHVAMFLSSVLSPYLLLLVMITSVKLHGVSSGQFFSNTFYAADPLWDGQDCGPTSTCCIFNNPPWFCKQLPQPTNTDLEVRLCSLDRACAIIDNTPVELIEIYVKKSFLSKQSKSSILWM